MDGTTIGLLGLLLAGFGVLATLVAPRLIGQARVHFEDGVISRIRNKEEFGDVRIRVTSGGNDVDGEIYLASGRIRNIGSRDVALDNFIDPVRLELNGPYDLLSFDIESDEDIGAESSRLGNAAFVSWRILKPGESINTRFIIRSSSAIRRRHFRRLIKPVIRLRDVRTGHTINGRFRIPQFLVTFATIMCLVAVVVAFASLRKSNEVVITDDAGPARIRVQEWSVELCRLEQRRFYISQCVPWEGRDLSGSDLDVRVEPVFPGVRLEAIWALLFLAIMYSAGLTYSIPTFLQILRSTRGKWDQ